MLWWSESIAQPMEDQERLSCDYEACNCVFAEIGANGVGLSLNYEKLVSRKVGIRVGVGSVLLTGTTIPVSFSWYSGVERKFEFGLGVTYLPIWEARENNSFGKSQTILLCATIGGKFQPRFGGFMIRFAATPFYSLTTNTFIFFGGISLGHSF
jgi:hypothetical protein